MTDKSGELWWPLSVITGLAARRARRAQQVCGKKCRKELFSNRDVDFVWEEWRLCSGEGAVRTPQGKFHSVLVLCSLKVKARGLERQTSFWTTTSILQVPVVWGRLRLEIRPLRIFWLSAQGLKQFRSYYRRGSCSELEGGQGQCSHVRIRDTMTYGVVKFVVSCSTILMS